MGRPTRRTDLQRVKHLDAHIQPVEDALLARAAILDERAAAAPENPELGISPEDARLLRGVASEFRALADELHYW